MTPLRLKGAWPVIVRPASAEFAERCPGPTADAMAQDVEAVIPSKTDKAIETTGGRGLDGRWSLNVSEQSVPILGSAQKRLNHKSGLEPKLREDKHVAW